MNRLSHRTITVSERVYLNLSYASRVYKKARSEIIEKLLDAPLNVTSIEMRAKLPISAKRVKPTPSNIDVIEKGVELLRDTNPEMANKCVERLNEVLRDKSPFESKNT